MGNGEREKNGTYLKRFTYYVPDQKSRNLKNESNKISRTDFQTEILNLNEFLLKLPIIEIIIIINKRLYVI